MQLSKQNISIQPISKYEAERILLNDNFNKIENLPPDVRKKTLEKNLFIYPDTANKIGHNLAMLITFQLNSKTIKNFIIQGAALNNTESKTPLMALAASTEHNKDDVKRLAKILINTGADVNIQFCPELTCPTRRTEHTALDYARQTNKQYLVTFLKDFDGKSAIGV